VVAAAQAAAAEAAALRAGAAGGLAHERRDADAGAGRAGGRADAERAWPGAGGLGGRGGHGRNRCEDSDADGFDNRCGRDACGHNGRRGCGRDADEAQDARTGRDAEAWLDREAVGTHGRGTGAHATPTTTTSTRTKGRTRELVAWTDAASTALQVDATTGGIRESTAHWRPSNCRSRRRSWRHSWTSTGSWADGTLVREALAGGAPPLPQTGVEVAMVVPAPLPLCRPSSRMPAADGPCSPRPTTPSGPW
jgi:hypothetical protein